MSFKFHLFSADFIDEDTKEKIDLETLIECDLTPALLSSNMTPEIKKQLTHLLNNYDKGEFYLSFSPQKEQNSKTYE